MLPDKTSPYFKEEIFAKDQAGGDYLSATYEWRDGKLNGIGMTFWPDGTRKSYADFKDDLLDGLFKTWHPNGAIESAGIYKSNLRIGIHEVNDTEGRLTCLLQYAHNAKAVAASPLPLRKTYYDHQGPTLDLFYEKDNVITARHFPRPDKT